MFDFLSDIVSFFKLCMIACFLLAFTFMVLVSLPRSPLRNACMQALLWGIAFVADFLVVSPADFIPLPLFPDDLLYGGAGLLAAGSALVQKIRQRREERELAMWRARMQASASYPDPKTLLVTSNKERESDEYQG